MKNRIWTDRDHMKWFFLVLIIFVGGAIFLETSYNIFGMFLKITLVSFLLFTSLVIFQMKLSHFDVDGIYLGNRKIKSNLGKIFKKREYILWTDIERLSFSEKEFGGGYGAWIVKYLEIKTKDGKKHNCQLKNKDSFVESLTKIGKGKLLS